MVGPHDHRYLGNTCILVEGSDSQRSSATNREKNVACIQVEGSDVEARQANLMGLWPQDPGNHKPETPNPKPFPQASHRTSRPMVSKTLQSRVARRVCTEFGMLLLWPLWSEWILWESRAPNLLRLVKFQRKGFPLCFKRLGLQMPTDLPPTSDVSLPGHLRRHTLLSLLPQAARYQQGVVSTSRVDVLLLHQKDGVQTAGFGTDALHAWVHAYAHTHTHTQTCAHTHIESLTNMPVCMHTCIVHSMWIGR